MYCVDGFPKLDAEGENLNFLIHFPEENEWNHVIDLIGKKKNSRTFHS